jgi:hypothetical protein
MEHKFMQLAQPESIQQGYNINRKTMKRCGCDKAEEQELITQMTSHGKRKQAQFTAFYDKDKRRKGWKHTSMHP